MSTDTKTLSSFDQQLRLFVYRHLLRHEESPTVKQMAKELASSSTRVRGALARLSESHAFMLQEDGELWRAAPFSCIPTAFPVTVGKKSWFGNCIWDALGIPAMLGKDALIGAACACCNYAMPVEIRRGTLRPAEGIIHIAVPAREWYKDVVFT
jgi:alkylmercury lyase-like protein